MFNKNRIKNYIFFKFNPSLRKYYLKKLKKLFKFYISFNSQKIKYFFQ